MINQQTKTHTCHCYIVSAKTKLDWLICSHVTLDKCNVSLGKQVKKFCSATNIKKTKWQTRIFKSCVETQ